jgi:hypothetical protein
LIVLTLNWLSHQLVEIQAFKTIDLSWNFAVSSPISVSSGKGNQRCKMHYCAVASRDPHPPRFSRSARGACGASAAHARILKLLLLLLPQRRRRCAPGRGAAKSAQTSPPSLQPQLLSRACFTDLHLASQISALRTRSARDESIGDPIRVIWDY